MTTYDYLSEAIKRQELVGKWLQKFLNGDSAAFDHPIPQHFSSRFTYLLSSLRNPQRRETALKIGDAAFEVLMTLKHPQDAELEPEPELPLIMQLLYLLECLPVSKPAEVVEYLDRLRAIAEYRNWPSAKRDCHRRILFALGNHLHPGLATVIRNWPAHLKPDLDDARYMVAAFTALANQAPIAALKCLTLVLARLEENGALPDHVLIVLADRLRDPLLRKAGHTIRETGRKDAKRFWQALMAAKSSGLVTETPPPALHLAIHDVNGREVGTVGIPTTDFGGINHQLLHEVVLMHRANQRSGTHCTKRRGEVAGSTRKLFRQKGTGNARVGPRRTNKRRGGGTVKGPKPRDYEYHLPKKAVRAATRMAILSKLLDHETVVVESLAFPEIKTKRMATVLKALHIDGTCLVGLGSADIDSRKTIYCSARNIRGVRVCPAGQFNAYEVLKPKRLLLTKAALTEICAGAIWDLSGGGNGSSPTSEQQCGAK